VSAASTIRTLKVGAYGRPVGTLAQTPEHEIFFEYSPGWLVDGFSISPYHLPLTPGLKREGTLIFDGLFGAFDDSLPDGWGLLLMDRFFRARGVSPEALSPLDRLAFVGDHGMGALEYLPANAEAAAPGGTMDLAAIAAQAERIVAGSAEEALPALRAGGASSGGSRPKVFVAYNPSNGRVSSDLANLGEGFEHWLVKFRAKEDPEDAGPIEAAYAAMAEAAGIAFPPHRLFETTAGRFFGVRRFDRGPGGLRVHTHTFGGMVHSHFRHPNRDYQELLEVTFSATKDFKQVGQAFRRAVFNVLAHNRDDHVKNHSFIADRTGRWRLSPAFDLTHSAGIVGQHNMTVAGSGNPGVPELLALARASGIRPREASAVIASVSAALGRWPEFAETAKVSPSSTAMVAASLVRAP
jgi:serine/threonine-protein kinase HipA